MFSEDCVKTTCSECQHHDNCLAEKQALKTQKQLHTLDKIKYYLALLKQQDKQ